MTLLNGVGSFLKSVGNFLLPGEPFKTSEKPISTVSVKASEIGTTNTKTVTTYMPKSDMGLQASEYGKTIYVTDPSKLQPGNILVAPNDYYLTSQAKSSGSSGNIWNVIQSGVEDTIKLGFNVLTQSVASEINKSPEIAYNPVTTEKVANPFKNYTSPQSLISGILNPILQPALAQGVESGIKGGINDTTNKVQIWLIVGVIVVALILFLKKR